MIQVKNVKKIFNKKIAVNNLSFQINRGEFVGFLGPNGAGKSTMINMLTGLMKPTNGEIKIAGELLDNRNFKWKFKIGMVTEDLLLYDHLSIWEHILLIGSIYGLEKKQIHNRGLSLLKYLDIYKYKNVLAIECSFGMKKKLAIALALIHKPEIIFFDEALTGIDPISLINVKKLISKLSKYGYTIFLTSHIIDLVEKIVDRIIIIAEGELKSDFLISKIQKENKSLEDVFISDINKDIRDEELSWLF